MSFPFPSLTDVLASLIVAFIGGGISSFMLFSLKKRRFRNEVSSEEFAGLDDALSKFSTQMLKMNQHIEVLSQKNAEAASRLANSLKQLEQEHEIVCSLKDEIAVVKTQLAHYEDIIEQVRERCNCDEDFDQELDNL